MDCVTLCLSCGRYDLLAPVLDSFVKSMPVPTEIIILDDKLSRFGQAKALDEMIRLGLTTHANWVMLLEDDWVFDGNKDWYYDSVKIFNEHPEVVLIGLSLTDDIRKYMKPTTTMSGVKIVPHDPWRLSPAHGWWNGWISSPRLMRKSDILLLSKFSNFVAEERFDQGCWKNLHDNYGKKSIWLDHTYVNHIGYGRSLFPSGDKLLPEDRTWLKAF
jgi:hypothetical protein